MKNSFIGILILIVGILSFKLFWNDYMRNKDTSKVDSTIVVNRIQKVLKLVTIEGNFSELMSYKDFDYIDFPGFRKDAIIKVDAKVSVGYNLEQLNIKTNEKEKTILIQNMPKPEIISIDTDIKFEQLSTGLFTNFNEVELSKLNALAKEKIRAKALTANIIQQTEEQKNELFDLLFYMAKSNGYTIFIEGKELQKINNLNN